VTVTYEDQARAWSAPPVDGVGYRPSVELLMLSDAALRGVIAAMEQVRYEGWRNEGNRWRDTFRLDEEGPELAVMDYGCGTGIEALQYARNGHRVTVADIAPENVSLAKRVLAVHGFGPVIGTVLKAERPRTPWDEGSFDVIHAAGVLHHIPWVEDVVEEIAWLLKPGGELRMMVYSDDTWRQVTDTEPPQNVGDHPMFPSYVRAMDAVGGWADWYNSSRVEERFGKWFDLEWYVRLDTQLHYDGARLVKR
jgi:SAM-dependent methyltransferase